MADSDSNRLEEKWYRVCLNTIVRAGEQLDSERLRILPMGSRVCVVEAAKNNGRRVRIKSPIAGWCSMSSSNGDTILAPIEDPNEVPNTPKNVSARVNALKQRKNQTEQLLNKASKDENVKKNVNESELRREVAHLEKRVKEAELQQKERDRVLQSSSAAVQDSKYERNQIVLCNGGVVGVIRWVGKLKSGESAVGLEVQEGAGDTDGIYNHNKGGTDRYFEVKPVSGLFKLEEDVKCILSPIDILTKLENTIAELSVTRNKYMQLANQADKAGLKLDENDG